MISLVSGSPYLQLGYQLLLAQVLLLHHLQPSILQDLPAAGVQAVTDEYFAQICEGHCWSQALESVALGEQKHLVQETAGRASSGDWAGFSISRSPFILPLLAPMVSF